MICTNHLKIISQSTFNYQDKLIETHVMVDEVNPVYRFEIKNAKGLEIKIFFPKSSCEFLGSKYPLLDSFSLNENHVIRHTENESFDAYIHTNMEVIKNDQYISLNIIDEASYFEIAISKDIRYQKRDSFFKRIKCLLLKPSSLITKEECLELNRRMVLSIYLLKVNSCGTFPAQETGLTCNSWNSKFHLEMHPIHSLWLAKYGLEDILIKQLKYYKTILKSAQNRAFYQGYLGARFPKMTSPLGEDSPSAIGPLLLWQQPHFILMLDACYKACKDISLIEQNLDILNEVILFLESFVYLGSDGSYHLDYPIIPAQECFDPDKTRDPIFEVEYVRFAFKKMIDWYELLNKEVPTLWQDIVDKMISPASNTQVYLACYDAQGKETYTSFAHDHPLVVMPYSFIKSDRIDKTKMKNTLNKVLETYDLNSLWGWDFPMLALAALHLGMKKEAKELLLMDTPKNKFLKNGHNEQGKRLDLPLYLPGNGAFLLAYIDFID
ncbi:MAG: hypothetical protein K2H02_02705 [Anaeroplasmataceae bacterium]|nr:hypothetical protein [Anaeroplasmataceae bacterium]